MEVKTKRKFSILISNREFSLLEIVDHLGPCSAAQAHEFLKDKCEVLQVMRCMHILVDRGLLERTVIGSQRLYRVKSNYKTIRTYLNVAGRPAILFSG